MENIYKKNRGSIGPGLVLVFFIGLVAKLIEGFIPMSIISASVIALFIGMLVNSKRNTNDIFESGIDFTSERLLKIAIILLGASLNLTTILSVGKLSLGVMVFTLLTAFGLGNILGKALGLNWKMANLISAGTGICGGSAIAAIAPVIDADDLDIAHAMSATFIFDMVMIVTFPIIGRSLGLSDMAYGLWTGTAVNDTSSVVAAGFAYSERAGNFATMVKLTRTLVIIPTVIIYAIVSARLRQGRSKTLGYSIRDIFPFFIIGFLAMALINSLGLIPSGVGIAMKDISKFLMVMALAAIGLNTSFADMKKSGPGPMVHGLIISVMLAIVALFVIYKMGLI